MNNETLNQNKSILSFIIILVTSIILKIPDLNAHLGGDIETYLLMGDAIINGEILRHYDNKSQITYFLYSILNFLSKGDLKIFQALGILIIFFSGFLISKINKNNELSLYSAIFLIFFLTLFNNAGNFIYTEHFAIIPLIISFIFFSKNEIKNFDLFIGGLFLSLTCLIRQNFLILHLFLAIYFLINLNKYEIRGLIYFFLGSCITWLIILIAIFYFQSYEGIKYFFEGIFSPILGSTSKGGYIPNFYALILSGLYIHNFNFNNIENIKIFSLFNLYFFSFLIFLKNFFKLIKHDQILFIYIISISLSIILTNSHHNHYLIQIVPFLILLIMKDLEVTKLTQTIIKINLLFLIIVLMFDYKINFMNKDKITHKETKSLIFWIKKNLNENDNIYLYRGSSAYMFIKQKPLTKFMHPNNIFKENYLKYINKDKKYNSRKEWEKILSQKPKYLIFYETDNIEKFFKKLNIDDYYTDTEYVKNNSIQLGKIYKALKIEY